MRQRQHPFLRVRIEVDEQIAAAHQIHFRIGRIGEQVLRREHHAFADRGLDPVIVAGLVEKALEPFGRQAFDHAARIDALARRGEIVVSQVGGENLDAEPLLGGFIAFGDHHRDRVGFLARRAGRNPGTDRSVGRGLLDQRPDHFAVERVPRLGISEEARDIDHHVPGELGELVGIAAQPVQIGVERFYAGKAHPPVRAAGQVLDLYWRKS